MRRGVTGVSVNVVDPSVMSAAAAAPVNVRATSTRATYFVATSTYPTVASGSGFSIAIAPIA